MKVSVVIVNYNVKNFLEQCLCSVIKALEGVEGEVIVADNHSVDGSQAMVKTGFPDIKLIENLQNSGFAKANNQAIRIARGEYILVLNPDTLLEEETIKKCIAFMNDHPDAGALGVKMINGKGKYLPESKRALPTPAVAFYKIFGLSFLFPRSKLFARYHLSYLDPEKVHEVEVLSGAFMFLRKSALDKAGWFDEDFFMYGEDVDLSYRLKKAGYKNYYFPETTIIHYKGESTRKSSINYVKTFYGAMLVFTRKHFSHKQNSFFYLLLKLAIYFRGLVSAGRRVFEKAFLPLADAGSLYLALMIVTRTWEQIKFKGGYSYPAELTHYIFPAYILLWMGGLYFAGAYKKVASLKQSSLGIVYGTITILVLYSLLPETLRFSRALVLLGGFASLFTAAISRKLADLLGIMDFYLFNKPVSRIAFMGRPPEKPNLFSQLQTVNHPFEILGNVYEEKEDSDTAWLGSANDIEEIVRINKINEIIFSQKDLSIRQIIDCMHKLAGKNISFKILSADGQSIVGAGPGPKNFLSMGIR
jgi:O-antigen biosynthesis protein